MTSAGAAGDPRRTCLLVRALAKPGAQPVEYGVRGIVGATAPAAEAGARLGGSDWSRWESCDLPRLTPIGLLDHDDAAVHWYRMVSRQSLLFCRTFEKRGGVKDRLCKPGLPVRVSRIWWLNVPNS